MQQAAFRNLLFIKVRYKLHNACTINSTEFDFMIMKIIKNL